MSFLLPPFVNYFYTKCAFRQAISRRRSFAVTARLWQDIDYHQDNEFFPPKNASGTGSQKQGEECRSQRWGSFLSGHFWVKKAASKQFHQVE
jgi:hypothetical protein